MYILLLWPFLFTTCKICEYFGIRNEIYQLCKDLPGFYASYLYFGYESPRWNGLLYSIFTTTLAWKRKLFSDWFSIGVIFMGLGQFFVLVILIVSCHNSMIMIFEYHETQTNSISSAVTHPDKSTTRHVLKVTPLIPGINMPENHLLYFWVGTFVVLFFHELGHAAAACVERLQIQSIGVFFWLLFPGAYVRIEDSVQYLPTGTQLRIYCAGVWSNIILCLVLATVSALLPYPLSLSHTPSPVPGAVVTHLPPGSPLLHSLRPGDVIVGVNGLAVGSSADWLERTRQLQNETAVYSLKRFQVWQLARAYLNSVHIHHPDQLSVAGAGDKRQGKGGTGKLDPNDVLLTYSTGVCSPPHRPAPLHCCGRFFRDLGPGFDLHFEVPLDGLGGGKVGGRGEADEVCVLVHKQRMGNGRGRGHTDSREDRSKQVTAVGTEQGLSPASSSSLYSAMIKLFTDSTGSVSSAISSARGQGAAEGVGRTSVTQISLGPRSEGVREGAARRLRSRGSVKEEAAQGTTWEGSGHVHLAAVADFSLSCTSLEGLMRGAVTATDRGPKPWQSQSTRYCATDRDCEHDSHTHNQIHHHNRHYNPYTASAGGAVCVHPLSVIPQRLFDIAVVAENDLALLPSTTAPPSVFPSASHGAIGSGLRVRKVLFEGDREALGKALYTDDFHLRRWLRGVVSWVCSGASSSSYSPSMGAAAAAAPHHPHHDHLRSVSGPAAVTVPPSPLSPPSRPANAELRKESDSAAMQRGGDGDGGGPWEDLLVSWCLCFPDIVRTLLSTTFQLSLSVAVLNLLPLPQSDGSLALPQFCRLLFPRHWMLVSRFVGVMTSILLLGIFLCALWPYIYHLLLLALAE